MGGGFPGGGRGGRRGEAYLSCPVNVCAEWGERRVGVVVCVGARTRTPLLSGGIERAFSRSIFAAATGCPCLSTARRRAGAAQGWTADS